MCWNLWPMVDGSFSFFILYKSKSTKIKINPYQPLLILGVFFAIIDTFHHRAQIQDDMFVKQ